MAAIDNCFALIGALGSKGSLRHGSPVHRTDSYATLMSPNKGETAVHGCHCRSDMAERMLEVLARPRVSHGLVYSHRIGLGHQNGRRFVLEHYYGGRDVT